MRFIYALVLVELLLLGVTEYAHAGSVYCVKYGNQTICTGYDDGDIGGNGAESMNCNTYGDQTVCNTY